MKRRLPRPPRNPGLIDAIAAVGSQSELARRLSISRAAVCHWRRVPFRHLRALAEMTGVPRERLRPDLYE